MGILPDSQFGDVSVVDISADLSQLSNLPVTYSNRGYVDFSSDAAVVYAKGESSSYQLFASAVPGDPNGDIRVVSQGLNESGNLNRPIVATLPNPRLEVKGPISYVSSDVLKKSLGHIR